MNNLQVWGLTMDRAVAAPWPPALDEACGRGGVCLDATRMEPYSSFMDESITAMFKPGDRIIYRLSKHSSHPTPRAVEIWPEPKGEFYSYDVLKYWVVAKVQSDGRIVAVTRRGKSRTIHGDDPALRRARWWERLLFSSRFPEWPARPEVEPKRRVFSYE
jgi:hypothetical protein